MAYSQKNSLGVEYFLNKKPVTLKNGGKSFAYYFTKVLDPITSLDEIPAGKEVFESPRNHILLLRKSN